MKNSKKNELSIIAAMPCMVCQNIGIPQKSPTNLHHVRHDGKGGNMKRDDAPVIPLCFEHHQFHGWGVSIHDGLEIWEQKFGTEQELVARLKETME